MAPLRDELLQPIPGDARGGVALRYDPLYDKIKEARREGEDAWGGDPKKADWPLVVKLAREGLAKKSKDLQLAAWLTEALVRRDGYGGLRDGLDLLAGMLELYWDDCHPEIEDGDLELRAAPLQWVGLKLDLPVRMVPFDSAGHDLLRYRESRMVPTETDTVDDERKATQRAEAISEGKVTPEEFDSGFHATPVSFYQRLYADVTAAQTALASLDEHTRERFGDDDAPSYGSLRQALEDAQMAAKQLLLRKDPGALTSVVDDEPGVELPPNANVPTSAALSSGARVISEPTSRDDASALVERAARYLRRAEPLNPASYLMLRGFRWGELRAGGSSPDPRLLEAPGTPVRTQLKSLLLDARWRELIEMGETVMATPQGRGWLDLQRYVLTACDALAGEYDVVAAAIRAELRALLTDIPRLIDMTLMDDTPTANAETREWLRVHVLDVVAAPAHESTNGDGREHRNGQGARALAAAEAKSGRHERAIELLMRELSQEKSKRGRFICQTQLAGIMVDSGHEGVALPILQEMLQFIEAHRLEEWESGDVVAKPMALLYRCLEATDGDPAVRHELYLRICRLDPLQAMGFAQP